MTTIAASVKFKQIAADSMASADGYYYSVSKLIATPTGGFGGTGEWPSVLKYIHGIQNGAPDDELDVTVLELRDNTLWLWDGTERPFAIKQEFYAIGTGAAYAICAMHLGKSPAEAVEIASLFDPGTRAPIDIIDMGGGSAIKSKRR